MKRRRIRGHIESLFTEMGGQKVFLLTLFSSILSSILPYGLNWFLSKNFAPDDFGEISAVLSVAGFLSIFILLGSDQACLKFIPEYLAKKQYDKLKGLHQFYVYSVVLLCLILTVLCFGIPFFIELLGWNHLDIPWEYFWVTPLTALLSFFMMVLSAIKKPVDSVLTYYVWPSICLIVALFLWKNAFGALTLRTTILIYSAILVVVIVYQAAKIIKTLDPKIFDASLVTHNKLWFTTGVQLLFILLLSWGEGLVNFLFKLAGPRCDNA